MALKAILTKLDDAPEALREFYQPGAAADGTEGRFVLKVEAVDGFALENVTGLKSALGAERTQRERLEKDVVKFKDLDPDRARAALVELEELKKIDPASEADKIANTKFEAARAQLLEKHTGELTGRDQRIGFLAGTVDELLREQRATAAIAEAKGSVDLLLPHVLKNTRTVEKDGKFSVEVIDSAGNVRIADGQGNPMKMADLVAEMRKSDTFARAFDGDGHSGSGKEHDSGGGGGGAGAGSFGGSREERQAAVAAKFPGLPAR